MKIVIFGATGKTGLELVKQSLEKGHSVTAFVRDPSRLDINDERLTLYTGDVNNPANVSEAIQDHEAVICALGAGSDLKKTTVRTTGTINIVDGMKKNHVKRLAVISAMGVGESWNSLSFTNKTIFATLLKSSREDHEAQEVVVKESGLDWTIVRPSGLTDTPRTGLYEVGENVRGDTSRISAADVADLVLNELEQNEYLQKAITITN